MITEIRRRFSSWLHLQAVKVYDDFQEWTWVTPDGYRVHWCHYYQGTGSWTEGIEYSVEGSPCGTWVDDEPLEGDRKPVE